MLDAYHIALVMVIYLSMLTVILELRRGIIGFICMLERSLFLVVILYFLKSIFGGRGRENNYGKTIS